jgi:hypothetical protein
MIPIAIGIVLRIKTIGGKKVLPSVQLRGVSPKLQTLIIFVLLYFKPF